MLHLLELVVQVLLPFTFPASHLLLEGSFKLVIEVKLFVLGKLLLHGLNLRDKLSLLEGILKLRRKVCTAC